MRARSLERLLLLVAFGLLLPGACAGFGQPYGDVYGPFPVRLAASERADSPEVSEAERVSREIVRTDRMLVEVGAKVGRTKNEKARAELENGRARQLDSKSALASRFYARAMRLTLEARAFGKSALIKVGPADQDPDFVAKALEQTDDALHRADDLIEGGADSRTHVRIESLGKQQGEARQVYKDGDYPKAYTLTRRVRDGVLDLLRQLSDLPVTESTARRAIRRAEHAMTQGEEELGAHPTAQAKRLEMEARVQMQKARASYARKSYRDALLHAKLVERNLEIAIDAERVATSRSE